MSLVVLNKASEGACRKKYESAIFQAARRGCFNDHALAQELYGAFCQRQSDVDDARYHTQRAIEIYGEWGATRVASILRDKHSRNGMSFPVPQQLLQPPLEISVCTSLGANRSTTTSDHAASAVATSAIKSGM
jgi:hypothetical protein